MLSVWAFALMPDAGRVAPIRGSVLCLRLVVAFGVALLSDFVNASPYQMTPLTDFQYALCDGAEKWWSQDFFWFGLPSDTPNDASSYAQNFSLSDGFRRISGKNEQKNAFARHFVNYLTKSDHFLLSK